MPRSLSVLVVTRDPGAALAELVAGWDGQSAPSSEFEVVVADAGSTDGSAARLRQLAERRPNVVVLDLPAGSTEHELVAEALTVTSGEYVLALDQDSRLAPRAVELLLRQAGRTQADVVLGRRSGTGSGSALLPADEDRIDPARAVAALPASAAAVRRGLLDGVADPAAALLAPTGLLAAAETAVAAVGSSLVVAPADADEAEFAPKPESVEVRWAQGRLEVEAQLGGSAGPAAPRAWLVAAAAGGLAEVAVPAEVEAVEPVDPDANGGTPVDEGRWRLRARLDPATADAGTALVDGVWNLRLRLAGADGEATSVLPPVRVPNAVLDGRPITVPAPEAGLQLDLGATRGSVVNRVAPEQASVTESRAGSLLTLDYPDLHVHGDSRLPASLRLDTFGLVARFVAEDGRARLECFVTGLAGTSAISVLVGSGRPTATGLNLDIDGTGRMSLRPTPKPEPKPAATPAPAAARPAANPPASSGPRPLVQRLRRLTPAAAEPAVRYLASVGPLRDAYRRLLRR